MHDYNPNGSHALFCWAKSGYLTVTEAPPRPTASSMACSHNGGKASSEKGNIWNSFRLHTHTVCCCLEEFEVRDGARVSFSVVHGNLELTFLRTSKDEVCYRQKNCWFLCLIRRIHIMCLCVHVSVFVCVLGIFFHSQFSICSTL